MLKIRFLRNILLLSAAVAILYPLYNILFTHPSYRRLLVHETESEAVRYVRYLTRTLELDRRRLEAGNLPPTLAEEVGVLRGDALLAKLRVFAPTGEIVYSTEPAEVGTVNRKPYFRRIVAKGELYSKVVRKDSLTAENEPVAIDVVETYVPIMVDGAFGGAVEVYYDITENRRVVDALTYRTTALEFALSAAYLLIILMLLSKARNTIESRRMAEAELEKAKEDLEDRVRRRTAQLTRAVRELGREVAERKRAEQSLHHALKDAETSRQKIAGILKSVPDGLLVTDDWGRIVLMNAAAEETLGLRSEEVEGQAVETALRQTGLEKGQWPDIGRQGGAQPFDFTLAGPDPGHPRVFNTRIFPLETGHGTIFLMQEVTGEREIERMKSEFLARTTHELQTPLTAIMGYSELLLTPEATDLTPEHQRDFLGQVYRQAESLSGLINDLLDLNRVASGRVLPLKRATIAMGDFIREAVENFRGKENGRRFEVRVPEQPLEVTADRDRIAQVLAHLLENAVKYSPSGGRILVTGEVADGCCRIGVEDEGIGMTEEQTERAFDLFYRADTSDTAVRGTGLGLTIVKQFVEAHGGDVGLQSEPGRGTRVWFTLPLYAPREGAGAAAE